MGARSLEFSFYLLRKLRGRVHFPTVMPALEVTFISKELESGTEQVFPRSLCAHQTYRLFQREYGSFHLPLKFIPPHLVKKDRDTVYKPYLSCR